MHRSTGFDSLQDLLEREGYKETRIITPLSKSSVIISVDEDMDTETDLPARQSKPALRHATSAGLFQRDTNQHDAPAPAPPGSDILAWRQAVAQTSDIENVPMRRQALQKSRSDASLKRHVARRRSTLWDASQAYRQSVHTTEAVPPVPPIPPTLLRASSVATTSAAPQVTWSTSATLSQPEGEDPTQAFLSSPASPILSRQDAVVQITDADPVRMPRGLRRSKSEDLLQKALKSRTETPPDVPPLCNCGRTMHDTKGKGASMPAIEPRWHMDSCPVRLRWEATAPLPIPPPPPYLTVSTPRGISSPKAIELAGAEFDPVDTPGQVTYLFRVPRPDLSHLTKATWTGLHSWWTGHEEPAHSKGPFLNGGRTAVSSSLHPPSPMRPKSSTHRRLRRSTSIPRVERKAAAVRSISSDPTSPSTPSTISKGQRTGSERVHELRQRVEDRMKEDATVLEETAFPLLSKYTNASAPTSQESTTDHSVLESPTVQRMMQRGTHSAPTLLEQEAAPQLALGETVPSLPILQTMTQNDLMTTPSSTPQIPEKQRILRTKASGHRLSRRTSKDDLRSAATTQAAPRTLRGDNHGLLLQSVARS